MAQKTACDQSNRTVPTWASLMPGDLFHYCTFNQKCYEHVVVERTGMDQLVVLRLPRNGSVARCYKTTFEESRTLARGFIHLGEQLDTYFAKQTRNRKKTP